MPKELKILINPNPVLRQKSVAVDLALLKDPIFQKWLRDLEFTMTIKDGAGLAAPQVGKNIRLFVISHENQIFFIINPKITKKSWGRTVEDEGCLSVLDEKGEIIYAPIPRHKKISCSYFDEKGNLKKINADKFLARVIQHENDHLDGVLFIDYLEKGLPGK
jgi:peptide deformylase